MLTFVTLDRPILPAGPKFARLRQRGLVRAQHPWVARVALRRGRLEREFLRPLHNWRDATPDQAGVRCEWYLNAGPADVFEVNRPSAWHTAERYYCRFEGEREVRLSWGEARALCSSVKSAA